MLAGLEEITDGRILIGDRVVNNVAPGDRDVAMVFQSYALYPHMTVYDNLAFGLRNHKVPKAEIDERVRRRPRSSTCRSCSSASRSSSPAASASASRSAGRSCASRRRS